MQPTFGTQTWMTPYGLMLVVALACGWLYARRRAVVAGLDVSHIDLAVPLVFVISLLGARFLTVLSPGDAEIAGDLYQAHVRFRLFGLLFVGVPLLFVYARLAKLHFRSLLDVFALPAVLWLVIIRMGCFMAGCCWGDLAHENAGLANVADPQLAIQIQTLPWLTGDWLVTATSFPIDSFAYQQHQALGLIEPAATSSLPVHPTQLYELVLLAVLLVIMWIVEKSRPAPGIIALGALAGYAVLRFFIEFLRADNALVLGALTFSQVICIVLFCGCLGSIWWVSRLYLDSI